MYILCHSLSGSHSEPDKSHNHTRGGGGHTLVVLDVLSKGAVINFCKIETYKGCSLIIVFFAEDFR